MRSGEIITVMESGDNGWVYAKKTDGKEGWVPSGNTCAIIYLSNLSPDRALRFDGFLCLHLTCVFALPDFLNEL